MVRSVLSFAALVATAGALSIPAEQQPLRDVEAVRVAQGRQRPLHGRFLHITDIHPDSFYKVYSSTSEDAACHSGTGPAGIYGAETSECDSPFALVNKTFEWIGQEFRDNIDFIVWTGDSARHDNDEQHPRNTAQVASLNAFLVQKMYEIFGKRPTDDEDDRNPNNDYIIPIVPTLGNNDVLPHNIMTRGPNAWTRAYTRIWAQFIPEAQTHAFEQGGWFYVEVIPNRLAVFSLNTLYFFQSNAAVDGCAAKTEPGYRQMEWLRIQLQYMRERGVKAILMGHVPPARTQAKTQWDETCWQKYALWMRQYRDVVVGGLWGHMNYDHFFLQDFGDIEKQTEDGRMRIDAFERGVDDDVEAEVSNDYFIDLREQFAELPKPPKKSGGKKGGKGKKSKKSQKEKLRRKQKKYLDKIGGEWAENYAVSFASASVVPNLLPVVRVFEYNITGLDSKTTVAGNPALPEEDATANADADADAPARMDFLRRKKKKPKSQKFVVPSPPSDTAPPGPAYSPQTLSLLGYTQYLANLTRINNDFTQSGSDSGLQDSKWKEGKHKGRKPHDKDASPNPKDFAYEIHYDTRNDSVYGLEDLTMPNMLALARRIGAFVPEQGKGVGVEKVLGSAKKDGKKKKKKKGRKGKGKHGKGNAKRNEAWYTFIRRAFVETLDEQSIEAEFGR